MEITFSQDNAFGNLLDGIPSAENTEVKEPEQQQTEEPQQQPSEIDPNNLFGQTTVEENKPTEDNTDKGENTNTPPSNKNPFSSIANVLKDTGVLPDVSSDKINAITDGEGFTSLIEDQVAARLDEVQKRVHEALSNGVPASDISMYENTLTQLNGVTEDVLNNEQNENLRKSLIYQDYINRGFSQDRATREVERSFKSGEDINDAKDALESLKSYYSSGYENLRNEAADKVRADKARIEQEAAKLKAVLLDNEEIIKGIPIDKGTRRRAYDAVTKPIFKDEDGNYYTAIQKYQKENPVEFRKNLAVVYALTDGFTKMDKLGTTHNARAFNSKIKELDHVISGMSTHADGSLNFIGVTDPESHANDGWVPDV